MDIEEIRNTVDREGFGYFLTEYASPENVDRASSPEADEFAQVWNAILPSLRRLQDLAISR